MKAKGATHFTNKRIGEPITDYRELMLQNTFFSKTKQNKKLGNKNFYPILEMVFNIYNQNK